MKKFVILLALAFSLFVYLFYRSSATVAPLLLAQIMGQESFLAVRAAVRAHVWLDEFAVYSLPEGLWVLCLTLASRGLTISVGKCLVPLDLLPPAYAVGLELAQGLGLVRGRFDPVDIAVSLWLWTAGVLLHPSLSRNLALKPDRRLLALAGCWSIVYLAHVQS
ncbi:MAG: hypothetical protein IPN71_07035 [Fibrobacteres bacterium]|nr:hypothetical protein [Fibrobacterota bacterium]